MLNELLHRKVASDEQPAIITQQRSTTWAQLRTLTESFLNEYKNLAQCRIGLIFQPVAESYAALAALEKLNCDVFLLNSQLPLLENLQRCSKFRLGACVDHEIHEQPNRCNVHELSDEAEWSAEVSVTILTSGSTGEPKAARHTWESLSNPVRERADQIAPRWLLTYRPDLYAGLQVALQCFSDAGTLVIAGADLPPAATFDLMKTAGVQFVSATPSFWKRLLFAKSESFDQLSVKQITLGGEVVEQSVLDALRQRLPQARIVHIYATTELGRCFAVHDGLAGFPKHYLEQSTPDGVEMQVKDGELWIKSPNAMKMYDSQAAALTMTDSSAQNWIATGDLVEIKEDRLYFKGRKSEIINVAGSKVHPLEVERVIRDVPGVADVRVFGKASSVAGELVACQIVAAQNQNPDDLKQEVHRVCMTQLTAPQQPRLITFVQRIEISSSGKTLRTKLPEQSANPVA